MNNSYLVAAYVIYAAIAIPLVVWLARTLTENGATFLADVFKDRPELASACNRLLAIGFLLLNLGYALLLLTSNRGATTMLGATELLITKFGVLLLTLGLAHFFNMLVFWKIKNRAEDRATLPVAPTFVQSAPAAAPGAPFPAPR